MLGRLHPEVAGFSSAFVIVTRPEMRDEIGAAVTRLVDAANGRRSVEIERAVDEILTSFAPRADDQELEAKRQAQEAAARRKAEPEQTVRVPRKAAPPANVDEDDPFGECPIDARNFIPWAIFRPPIYRARII